MDPLDWLHQWDDFEMYMFAEGAEDGGEPGIYMQVSRRVMHQGAEEWEMLYERRLGDLPEHAGGVASSASTQADGALNDAALADDREWEDKLLRIYLKEHPNLVPDEKEYLHGWLKENEQ